MMNVVSLKPKPAATPSGSLVKSVALGLFKAVRVAGVMAQAAPSQLAHSFNEVRDAWEESRPKA